MNEKLYSMQETCEKTGLTYDTLKFYCNQGLVPYAKRDKNNRRVFSENDITWAKSLSCLKHCGMSIAEMKNYVSLCLEGEKTILKRKAILIEKQQGLRQKIAALEESIEYIDWKLNLYNDFLLGKKKYYINLKRH